ncbi:N-acetylmuramoyl-L-alanine amidase, partial [Candidatus Aerophobetes bacterium]|nr:N-acetylmuramoyl-L-alanine amidase [Candidatus Aerophobetes bacterium]
EKDVVLAVAKELAKLLEEEPGVKVYLTRRDDTFYSLNQRTEMANQLGGDIFISIHANATLYNKEASGVETFFNSRYSYGEGAEAVAATENVFLGSEDVSEEAKAIFWDLIQDRYRNESNDLSYLVQEELSETTGLENRGVKSAPFYVLRGAAMPAILVEIGFISNPWEERKLKGEDFRKRIALGIFKGLKAYLK